MNIRHALIAVALASPVAGQCNPLYEVTADTAHACGLSAGDPCGDFPKGYRFEANNWQDNAKTVGGTTIYKEGTKAERELYIFNGKDVAPVLDAKGNMTEPACKWPTGGVMQHAVTDAQGRVYIKRVEVVNKCVNGKMTTIQRALN